MHDNGTVFGIVREYEGGTDESALAITMELRDQGWSVGNAGIWVATALDNGQIALDLYKIEDMPGRDGLDIDPDIALD